MSKERLIKTTLQEHDLKDLSSGLVVIMKNIEAAFIAAGAVPNKDYTYNDLMTHALTYVSNEMKSSFSLDFDL